MKVLKSQEPKTSTPDDHLQSPPSQDEVFYQYRGLLFSIAYRMLGSVAEVEDILQDTFIRWRQSSHQRIQSPRAFLVTILSRLCIQHLQSARLRREEYVGQWLPEPVFTGKCGDPSTAAQNQESLSMAFLLLLEKLTPLERAVFLLHEVFEYEYSEMAQIVGKSEANCRQILRRARQHILAARPRFDTSPEHHHKLLQKFMAAASGGDLSGFIALLSKDVVLYSDGGGKADAALNPIYGSDHVARFLLGAIKKSMPANVLTQVEQINGQPSIIYSLPGRRAGCVLALDIANGYIQNIYVVTNPEKLQHLFSV
ncbi:MAG TPA: RNA polymerase sigma-70 factor [Alphaproteobacteria bacterium]|nr:RNA polymerase sigma-70 factor [Alphaproteobacteria bacterium]